MQLEVEEEDEELVGEAGGDDSEAEPEEEEDAADTTAPAGAVAEGVEEDREATLRGLVNAGVVETHYAGPTARMMSRWRRLGAAWWDRFFPGSEEEADLPPLELEDDIDFEDTYNYNDTVGHGARRTMHVPPARMSCMDAGILAAYCTASGYPTMVL